MRLIAYLHPPTIYHTINKIVLDQTSLIKNLIVFLFLLFLPTQLGKHFFFDFSYVSGVRIDYLSYVLYTTDILAIILALVFYKSIFTFVVEKRIYILFFLALAFLNVSLSQTPQIGLYSLLKIIEFVVVFVVFTKNVFTKRLVFSALTIGAGLELVIATLQLYLRSSIQNVFYFLGERSFSINTVGIAKASVSGIEFLRPYATFSHPNSIAGFYLLLFFFAFTMTQKRKLILSIFSALIVLVSFSRSALFVFVVLNVLYLFLQKNTECKTCIVSRVILFSFLLLLIPYFHTDPLSLEKRLYLFKNSFEGFTIISGVGLGQYLYAQSSLPNPYPFFFLQPVHNIFMLFFIQAGVLLSTFVAWVLYRVILPCLTYIPFALCLLVVVLTGLVDHYWLTLQQNWLVVPVVFGLLTQYSRAKKDDL